MVQDLFLTETAQFAHVILPASSFAEKEGTITNGERRVQRLVAAEEPAGKSWPDWKILAELSQRMGLASQYRSAKEVLEEINELVPIYGGITSERLEKGGLHWPCLDKQDPGHPHLWDSGFSLGKRCFLSLKKSQINSQILPTPLYQRGDKGGFQLILGSTLFHFGSGTRSSRSPRLMDFCGQRTLRMNPEDARKMELEEGSRVKLTSGDKRMSFSISLDRGLLPGVLFLPVSPGEENVYDLLPFPTGQEIENPAIKTIPVKIERIEA